MSKPETTIPEIPMQSFFFVRIGSFARDNERYNFITACAPNTDTEETLLVGMCKDTGSGAFEADFDAVSETTYRRLFRLVVAHLFLSDEGFYQQDYKAEDILPPYLLPIQDVLNAQTIKCGVFTSASALSSEQAEYMKNE